MPSLTCFQLKPVTLALRRGAVAGRLKSLNALQPWKVDSSMRFSDASIFRLFKAEQPP